MKVTSRTHSISPGDHRSSRGSGPASIVLRAAPVTSTARSCARAVCTLAPGATGKGLGLECNDAVLLRCMADMPNRLQFVAFGDLQREWGPLIREKREVWRQRKAAARDRAKEARKRAREGPPR